MPVDPRVVTDDSPRTGDKATSARSFAGSGSDIFPGPANAPLGSAGFSRNEVVDIVTSGTTPNTFTITAEGVTTAAITFGATAAAVQAALVAAGGGMTTSTIYVEELYADPQSGNTKRYRLRFIGSKGNSNRTDVTVSGTGATAVKIQDGAAAPDASNVTYLGQTSGITSAPASPAFSAQAGGVIRATIAAGLPTGANKFELLVVQTPTKDVVNGTDAFLQELYFTSYSKELAGGAPRIGYTVLDRVRSATSPVNSSGLTVGLKVIAVVRGIDDTAGSEDVGPWSAQSADLTTIA